MTETVDHLRGLELARAGRIEEAETLFRALLDADPADADALHFFAVLAGQRQDFDEAERLLRQAIAARPNWGKGWDSLGRVYQSLGRLTEAAASYEQAIRYDPTDVRFYCDFGLALRELGKLPAAAAALRRATELEPRSADAHACLAAALKDMQMNREAEAAGRQAIEIEPAQAEAHNILGIVQRRQGRYADAEASCRRAIQLAPGAGLYRCNLANLLRDAGRFAEAEAEYRRAIELDPSYAESYRQLADLTPVAADDAVFARMETILAAGNTGPAQRIDLHFALAKALEGQRNYDAAFRHWEEANRLKRSTIDYDDSPREEIARQAIELFDSTLLARLAGSGNPSAAPIFIVGMPRSGTTLVEQILASHSAVTAGGELPVLGRIAEAAGYPASFANADAETLRTMGGDYLALAQPPGAYRFTDKMPGNFLRIGLIRLILPNARIVHCRRDPADICLSCYRQHFSGRGQLYSYDLHELGLEYRRYARLMDHWHSVVPDALYVVQYEALLDDAESEIRRLLEFCDLPFEAACLRFHETDRPVRTASASQVRRPIYQDARGRWKNYETHLTPLLKALEG